MAIGSHGQGEADAITLKASIRYQWFLRGELSRLPPWHPLHQEYEAQLEELRDQGVRAWSDESR